MPKHRKDPVITRWPSEDKDGGEPSPILLTVMKAFGRFDITTIVTVYHTAYHNRTMTKWTALVRTESTLGMRYYELYHDGTQTVFLNN